MEYTETIPYIPCPHVHTVFSTISILYHSGTYMSLIDKPTLTCPYHPKSIVEHYCLLLVLYKLWLFITVS